MLVRGQYLCREGASQRMVQPHGSAALPLLALSAVSSGRRTSPIWPGPLVEPALRFDDLRRGPQRRRPVAVSRRRTAGHGRSDANPSCPVVPSLPFCWEECPFKVNQPKKGARFLPTFPHGACFLVSHVFGETSRSDTRFKGVQKLNGFNICPRFSTDIGLFR